jgi:endonuclease YncB( thermonuclease family)
MTAPYPALFNALCVGRLVVISVVLLLIGACAQAQTLNGRVTHVYDGDTVSLRAKGTEHRVRLLGIDSPEFDQPYGTAARQHLERLVLDKEVRLETRKKDRYGRLLGKLWVQPAECPGCGRTLDVNLAMLTVGLAWWYRYYREDQSKEDQGRYEFAEYEAKSKRAGLWQDPDPTPPWDWPRGSRRADTAPDSGCLIKGNVSSNGRIYHMPGQKHYAQTRISTARGERWFCTEAEARAAGWRRARN